MIIAVIGDYESPEKYKNLRMQVAMFYPEESIPDLTRHKGTTLEMRFARWDDIESSNVVVVNADWAEQKVEVIKDIHQAQDLRKNIKMFQNGALIDFKQNAYHG